MIAQCSDEQLAMIETTDRGIDDLRQAIEQIERFIQFTIRKNWIAENAVTAVN
jgi:hypothetical protein